MPPTDPPNPPEGTPPEGTPPPTVLATGEVKPEQWIPEKFHKRAEGKKDGPIDVELSMRALAKSYGDVEARMKDTGLPPEDADKYDLAGEEIPKGFDIATFRKDTKTADFLKGAHSKGMTNAQVNYVIGKWLETAPELMNTAKQLTADECVARLEAEWKLEEGTPEYKTQIRRSNFAAVRLAGLAKIDAEAVNAKFGNDPDFIRMMAVLADQMGEDVPPLETVPDNETDNWETERAKLAAARDSATGKARQAAQDKLNAHYEKKFGKNKQNAVFVSGRTAA